MNFNTHDFEYERRRKQLKSNPLQPVDCFQVAFWCAVIFGVGGIVLTFAMWR